MVGGSNPPRDKRLTGLKQFGMEYGINVLFVLNNNLSVIIKYRHT